MKPGAIRRINQPQTKSKVHVKYEKLLANIESKQKFLTNLEAGLRKAYAKTEAELTPLSHEEKKLMRDYVIRLDELATEIGVGKFNKEWLTGFIVDTLNELLQYYGYNDTALATMHQKYTGQSFEETMRDEDLREYVQRVKNDLGFDIDMQELLKKGQGEYFKEHAGAFFNQQNDKADAQEQASPKEFVKSTENEKLLEKDAKLVYIRLIKKFHPDLVLDLELKKAYTEIAKQVTEAYHKKDFFNLLKLQSDHLEDNEKDEIEITDDLFKRYTGLLEKQLKKLKATVDEARYLNDGIINDLIDKNGNFSQPKFAAQLRRLQKSVAEKSQDLMMSNKRPKTWFKEQLRGIKDIMQEQMLADVFWDMFNDQDFI